MTATDWAGFWHVLYFYCRNKYVKHMLWFIGSIPSLPYRLNTWINNRIDYLNRGQGKFRIKN